MGEDFQFNWQGQGPITPPTFVTPQQRAEKEARKAAIRKRLAEIDALLAKHGQYSVAAEAATIGDMSPYMQLLSQQQNASATNRATATGIENMLYEAEKLTWGLDAKSAEDRRMARSNIDATLRRVEDQAARAGIDIKKNPAYVRLIGAVDNADKAARVRESERKKANEWWSKARNNELVNADIAAIEDFIEKNPDSDTASQLRPLVEQYKPKTRESKAAYEKRKSDARALRNELVSLDAQEATRRINGLSRDEYKLLQDFYPELLK